MDKYIVVWVSEKTECQGKSNATMRREVVERWCKQMNEKYSTIKHEVKQAS